MHLTKSQLKQIIKEELVALYEGDGDDVLPISGTELKTIQFVAKSKGKDIMKIARSVMAGLGATARNPKMVPIIKAFNKAFFPQLASIGKRVNIDVAEGLDMNEFLQDLLMEQEKLTKRQQAYKKGQARKGAGAMAYFKGQGGRPPLIVRKLEKELRSALLDGVSAELLMDAFESVLGTIKDPKDKKQYEKQYQDLLLKDPRKRMQLYSQNVNEFIDSVTNLATKAAESAVSGASPSDSKSGEEPAEAPQDTPTKVEDIPEEDIEAAKKLRMNPIEYVLLRSQAELGDKSAIKALNTRARPPKAPFKAKKPGFLSKLKGMFKEELEKELVEKLKRGK